MSSMKQFEVMYRLYELTESGNRGCASPTDYTTVVTAVYQGQAQQMVQAMNGGPDRCHVFYTKDLSNL